MNQQIRIVIADDHEIFRNGFKLLLKDQQQVQLVGEAENGKQLVTIVDNLHPDVVITDIKMPIMDGIEAIKLINARYPSLGIVALSMFNEDSLVIDMLEGGARGYLLKNTTKEELFTAIRAVYEGGTFYCAATSARLKRLIVESRFNPYQNKVQASFSERELAVIDMICRECTTKEIAAELGLSTRTVEGYRESILEKTGAKNQVGIAIFALKNGLVKLDQLK